MTYDLINNNKVKIVMLLLKKLITIKKSDRNCYARQKKKLMFWYSRSKNVKNRFKI